jgi:hypothetical protein
MLRVHCQWHCTGRATTKRLFQELCADLKPPMGLIGTPCGNMVWGIRYLIQEYYGQSVNLASSRGAAHHRSCGPYLTSYP